MKLPDLQMLANWLNPALVATLQTLWLMLAVSLDTQLAMGIGFGDGPS